MKKIWTEQQALITGGASGIGQMILANWPRCSSSRPLPPRPWESP